LTVRRALADLARAGVVRTEHGVGSFVASQPVRHRIDDGQVSLLESMAKDGRAVRQLVIDSRRIDPAGTGELPWSVSFAAVPAALAPRSWDGTTSLFAAMSAAHDLRIRRDERCFSAVPANPEDATWLDVQVGTPLLLLRGTNSDEQGRAVAQIVHRIRGDRAEYAVRVPR
jgi:DNA-binding GntR family transcriptional regulator